MATIERHRRANGTIILVLAAAVMTLPMGAAAAPAKAKSIKTKSAKTKSAKVVRASASKSGGQAKSATWFVASPEGERSRIWGD